MRHGRFDLSQDSPYAPETNSPAHRSAGQHHTAHIRTKPLNISQREHGGIGVSRRAAGRVVNQVLLPDSLESSSALAGSKAIPIRFCLIQVTRQCRITRSFSVMSWKCDGTNAGSGTSTGPPRQTCSTAGTVRSIRLRKCKPVCCEPRDHDKRAKGRLTRRKELYRGRPNETPMQKTACRPRYRSQSLPDANRFAGPRVIRLKLFVAARIVFRTR